MAHETYAGTTLNAPRSDTGGDSVWRPPYQRDSTGAHQSTANLAANSLLARLATSWSVDRNDDFTNHRRMFLNQFNVFLYATDLDVSEATPSLRSAIVESDWRSSIVRDLGRLRQGDWAGPRSAVPSQRMIQYADIILRAAQSEVLSEPHCEVDPSDGCIALSWNKSECRKSIFIFITTKPDVLFTVIDDGRATDPVTLATPYNIHAAQIFADAF